MNTDILNEKFTYFIEIMSPIMVYANTLVISINPCPTIDHISFISFIIYETNVPLSIVSKNLILALSSRWSKLNSTPCLTFLPVENIILRYKNVNTNESNNIKPSNTILLIKSVLTIPAFSSIISNIFPKITGSSNDKIISVMYINRNENSPILCFCNSILISLFIFYSFYCHQISSYMF